MRAGTISVDYYVDLHEDATLGEFITMALVVVPGSDGAAPDEGPARREWCFCVPSVGTVLHLGAARRGGIVHLPAEIPHGTPRPSPACQVDIDDAAARGGGAVRRICSAAFTKPDTMTLRPAEVAKAVAATQRREERAAAAAAVAPLPKRQRRHGAGAS